MGHVSQRRTKRHAPVRCRVTDEEAGAARISGVRGPMRIVPTAHRLAVNDANAAGVCRTRCATTGNARRLRRALASRAGVQAVSLR
ncbi:hypothetical protein WS68_13165 [Burkholderia sp. TSV86]|nr:hypothetical protein WS68_13165 [Burkholderia sp. TSV86]